MRGRHLSAGMVAVALAGAPTPALAAPPAVTTQPARNVATSSAQLRGTVNPQGAATTYFFQYGTTARYGAQTPTKNAGSGSKAVDVATAVGGLAPGTTYHFRLVARNA